MPLAAAGEEPYTLSLILSKHLAPFRFEIQATDLDFHILETAKRAQYTERSLKELPTDLKERHFTKRMVYIHCIKTLNKTSRLNNMTF